MTLPSDMTLLFLFTLALLMVMIATAIDSVRINRKLNAILRLLDSNTEDKDNVCRTKNNRHDSLPDDRYSARPKNNLRHDAYKNDKNNNYSGTSSHVPNHTSR